MLKRMVLRGGIILLIRLRVELGSSVERDGWIIWILMLIRSLGLVRSNWDCFYWMFYIPINGLNLGSFLTIEKIIILKTNGILKCKNWYHNLKYSYNNTY